MTGFKKRYRPPLAFSPRRADRRSLEPGGFRCEFIEQRDDEFHSRVTELTAPEVIFCSRNTAFALAQLL